MNSHNVLYDIQTFLKALPLLTQREKALILKGHSFYYVVGLRASGLDLAPAPAPFKGKKQAEYQRGYMAGKLAAR